MHPLLSLRALSPDVNKDEVVAIDLSVRRMYKVCEWVVRASDMKSTLANLKLCLNDTSSLHTRTQDILVVWFVTFLANAVKSVHIVVCRVVQLEPVWQVSSRPYIQLLSQEPQTDDNCRNVLVPLVVGTLDTGVLPQCANVLSKFR